MSRPMRTGVSVAVGAWAATSSIPVLTTPVRFIGSPYLIAFPNRTPAYNPPLLRVAMLTPSHPFPCTSLTGAALPSSRTCTCILLTVATSPSGHARCSALSTFVFFPPGLTLFCDFPYGRALLIFLATVRISPSLREVPCLLLQDRIESLDVECLTLPAWS